MAQKKKKQPPPWYVAFQRIEPYVVKITTPTASGTGFLAAVSKNKQLLGIATAAHVIDYPHFWEQPIRIEHFQSGKSVFLNHADRFIETNAMNDTGSIVLRRGELPIPDSTLPVIPEDKVLKVGVDVGWVGFPVIAPNNLCFFSGSISSWMDGGGFYFVDGVAINGVSGGPAFSINAYNEVQIIGVVSAYVPNRATGAQLPGLCVIRDIAPLQNMIKGLTNFEAAKQQEKAPETPPPSPPPAGSIEPTRS